MNILVIIIPVIAAGLFVAIWASRSGSSRQKGGNGEGVAYFPGTDSAGDGDNDVSDGGDAGDSGGGSDGGGGDGGGGGGGGD